MNDCPDHLIANAANIHTIHTHVYCDGVLVRNCTEAHRGEGWAIQYIPGKDGYPYTDGLGNIPRRTVRGKIEFVKQVTATVK